MAGIYPNVTDETFMKDLYAHQDILENYVPPQKMHPTESIEHVTNAKCGQSHKKKEQEEPTREPTREPTHELLPQQKLLSTYMAPNTPYNGLLVYHGTGVGKTCTAITIAETYKSSMKSAGKKIRIVCSKDLVPSFRNTIMNPKEIFQCTGDTYLSELSKSKTHVISKTIDEYYEFLTYDAFAKEVQNLAGKKDVDMKSPATVSKLEDKYSDSLIIIDEAQNIRDEQSNSDKLIMKAIERVTECAYNMKLVLLSATPMYDKPEELIRLLNILQRVYKHPLIPSSVLDKDGYIVEHEKENFIRAIKGKISFLKGENPYTFPFKLYDMRAVENITHDLDYSGKALKDTDAAIELPLTVSVAHKDFLKQMERLVSHVDFHTSQLQLHNMCWSFDETIDIQFAYSMSGMKQYFEVNREVDPTECIVKNKNPFLELDKYSPKFQNILGRVLSAKGIVMIYSRFVSSGILPLALMLETYGFTKFTGHGGASSMLRGKKDNSHKMSSKPMGTYAMFTSNPLYSGNKEKLLNIVNSVENTNGDIIKVILVSQVGGEGITLKCVREVHLLEPSYNMSDVEQTIGRAIRTCSHVRLPFEERNCIVYYHALKLPDGKKGEESRESVDMLMYRLMLKKHRAIQSLNDLIQENALDCALLKNLNFFDASHFPENPIRIRDAQNKKRDYTVGTKSKMHKCAYEPPDFIKSPKKSTRPDRLVHPPNTHQVLVAMRLLKNLFQTSSVFTLSDIEHALVEKYPSMQVRNIYFALDTLVVERIQFMNAYHESGFIEYRFQTGTYHFKKFAMFSSFENPLIPLKYVKRGVLLHEIDLGEREETFTSLSQVLVSYNELLESVTIFAREIKDEKDATKQHPKVYAKMAGIVADMIVDKLQNGSRMQHLRKLSLDEIGQKTNRDLQTSYQKYIEQAKHDGKDETYLISIPGDESSFMVEKRVVPNLDKTTHKTTDETTVETTDETTDEETNAIALNKIGKKMNFSSAPLFGYMTPKEGAQVFHIVSKEKSKKPRGSSVANLRKHEFFEFINMISGRTMYDAGTSLEDEQRILKSKTIQQLCVELEFLMRFYQQVDDTRRLFLSAKESYQYGLYEFLGTKKK